jgi:uncharacterized protein (DUF58 family)
MKALLIPLGAVLLVTSCEEKKQVKTVAPLVVPKRDWSAEIREHNRQKAQAELVVVQAEQEERLKQIAALRVQIAEKEAQDAQDQIEAERRARKQERRAMESAPAPMSQFDRRRLAAAGLTEFAPRAPAPPEKEPVIMNHMGHGNWIGSDGSKIISVGERAAIIIPGK